MSKKEDRVIADYISSPAASPRAHVTAKIAFDRLYIIETAVRETLLLFQRLKLNQFDHIYERYMDLCSHSVIDTDDPTTLELAQWTHVISELLLSLSGTLWAGHRNKTNRKGD